MYRDVTKENVEQSRVGLSQDSQQRFELHSRNLPGHGSELPKPKSTQEMRRRFADDVDWFKWKAIDAFAFLRNHHWPASLQPSDLPVDVEHLRL